MTERLYYEDSKLREFTASLVEQRAGERGLAVRLDRTAFYPTSGGQPHDTGTLNGHVVSDVWVDEGGEVWHLLPQTDSLGEIGAAVRGEIDWARRFDHMQQHSGQHMLSAAFVKSHRAKTIGFHLGADYSTIDLELPHLSWEAAAQVEDAVNQAVWEDLPLTVRFVTPEELPHIPLRKPPQVKEHVRVVWIGEYDVTACGGTHVSRTGEIGLIKITGLEHYKGGMRVTFHCGIRALRHYRTTHQLLRQASQSLSVGAAEVPQAVARLQADLKRTGRELHKLQAELAQVEAERLWESASEIAGKRVLYAHWADRPFAVARGMASYLQGKPRTALCFAVTEAKGTKLVCARSNDLPELNAAVILRDVAATLGGRGGGSPAMAQGGAGPHAAAEILAALQQSLRRAMES